MIQLKNLTELIKFMKFHFPSKFPINFPPVANSYFRQISTQITITPKVVEAMYKSSQAQSSNLLPNSQQIKNHHKILKELYKENPEFRIIANNLFKNFNNPNVKSIAFCFPQQPNLNPELSIFWKPVLVATALFSGIGIEPYINNQGFPIFAEVDKKNIAPILGHQDSMFRDPNDKDPSLINFLILVNGFSQSDAVTWFKESVDILNELKYKHPTSHKMLKDINVVARSRDPNEIGQRVPFKIIGDNDEINFVSSFVYTPSPIDLDRCGASKERMNLAILDLIKVANSESNRHEFVLNQQGAQILFLKNMLGLHGRGSVEENQKNLRRIIGIPLNYPHPSPSIQALNSVDRVSMESKDKLK